MTRLFWLLDAAWAVIEPRAPPCASSALQILSERADQVAAMLPEHIVNEYVCGRRQAPSTPGCWNRSKISDLSALAESPSPATVDPP